MNRFLFSINLLLLSVCLSAQTPNSWTRIADYPGTPKAGAIAFTIDSFGYFGATGIYRSDTIAGDIFPTDFWKYNPYTNTWIQKASFPGQGRGDAVCFVIGSKAYVGLGYYFKDFWEYDPATDTWTQKADFGGGQRASAVGFSIGTKGYAGLGSTNIPTNKKDIWEYDPAADTWTQKNDFAGGDRTAAIACIIQNKAFVGLGADSFNVFKRDFWKYDTLSDTWAQVSDFPGLASEENFSFAIGSAGYIGTGCDSLEEANINEFWEYNSVTDTWTKKDSFGGGNRIGATAFAIGNRGYAGTGYAPYTDDCHTDFWEYMPDSIATGIRQWENQMQALFYPNPVEDIGMLQTFTDQNTKASIDIFDLQGRIMESVYSGDLPDGNMSFNINTKALSAGVYIIVINSGEGKQIIKFTKL